MPGGQRKEDRSNDGTAVVTHVGSALLRPPPSFGTQDVEEPQVATFPPSLPPSLVPTCETARPTDYRRISGSPPPLSLPLERESETGESRLRRRQKGLTDEQQFDRSSRSRTNGTF